jgi:hypothetical protein
MPQFPQDLVENPESLWLSPARFFPRLLENKRGKNPPTRRHNGEFNPFLAVRNPRVGCHVRSIIRLRFLIVTVHDRSSEPTSNRPSQVDRSYPYDRPTSLSRRWISALSVLEIV